MVPVSALLLKRAAYSLSASFSRKLEEGCGSIQEGADM
jgi:hypothetical protein